jgi:hypothetical protein
VDAECKPGRVTDRELSKWQQSGNLELSSNVAQRRQARQNLLKGKDL